MTDDYKKGYKEGFTDGFKAGQESNKISYPDISKPVVIPTVFPSPTNANKTKCYQCGMTWEGVMGYWCPNMTCPMQTKTVIRSNNVTD